MAQWLRRPTVETLVFTGSSPALAKKLFFAKKNSNTNTVTCLANLKNFARLFHEV